MNNQNIPSRLRKILRGFTYLDIDVEMKKEFIDNKIFITYKLKSNKETIIEVIGENYDKVYYNQKLIETYFSKTKMYNMQIDDLLDWWLLNVYI